MDSSQWQEPLDETDSSAARITFLTQKRFYSRPAKDSGDSLSGTQNDYTVLQRGIEKFHRETFSDGPSDRQVRKLASQNQEQFFQRCRNRVENALHLVGNISKIFYLSALTPFLSLCSSLLGSGASESSEAKSAVIKSYKQITVKMIPDGGVPVELAAKFLLFMATVLLFTVASAKIFKILFRLPIVAGNIIGGVIVGPTLLKIKSWPIFNEFLETTSEISGYLYMIPFSEIFMFFLLLMASTITVGYLLWMAGHETDISEMMKVGKVSTYAGTLGAIVPIILVYLSLSLISGGSYSVASMVGIGIIFSATSVSIPIAILISEKKMHLRFAKATMGAAIVDDILAVIIFSIFMVALKTGYLGPANITNQHDAGYSVISSIARMLSAFIVMFLAGIYIVKPSVKALKKIRIEHLIPTLAIGTMFLFFSFAELVGGLAGITGSYFAGLFQRMSDKNRSAEKTVAPYVNSFLLPLFLGSVGMQVDLTLLSVKDWIMVVVIVFFSVLSKISAVMLSTCIYNRKKSAEARWSLVESYLFGASMVARGEVGIILATILRSLKIIDANQYIVSITAIVLTTIVTPILLSAGMKKFDAMLDMQMFKKIFTVKIGPFEHVAARQMFSIISTSIRLPASIKSIIQLPEGRKVLTLKNKLKVILGKNDEIIMHGNKKQIEELLLSVKRALSSDLDRINSSLSETKLD